ncbi:MAG: phenylacetate--CoA ligase family protein, partial [Victivallaceae bacterium]
MSSLLLNDDLSALDYVKLDYLRSLQLARLQNIVRHAFNRVKLFHDRMVALKLTPEDIKSLEDLAKLPFSVKNDLRDTYPFGLFACPMDEIVRLHASSG